MKTRKFTLKKTNNSIEYLLGNEKNEYPVPDLNRMMINMTNELNDIHKNFLKNEIMNGIIEILKKLQETVKNNVQNELKEYQVIINKKT
jgi:biotin-(acetyl-CoA carboxylase) ligase